MTYFGISAKSLGTQMLIFKLWAGASISTLVGPSVCPSVEKIKSKYKGNKLGLSWAKLSHSWGLKLEFEVKV